MNAYILWQDCKIETEAFYNQVLNGVVGRNIWREVIGLCWILWLSNFPALCLAVILDFVVVWVELVDASDKCFN